jgi:hypothetical protein
MIDATSPKRSGLAIVWDVIVAPADAVAALREATHWKWAFLIVCVLGLAGALLQIPASVHMIGATLAERAAHDPNLAAMSPASQAHIVAQTEQIQRYAWLFFPVIAFLGVLIAAGVMLLGSTIAKGSGTFARLFGLAANVAVINFGIAYLLIGVLVALRGPDAFSTQRDIATVLPSLAWMAPSASPKLATFLAAFNPFQIWSFILLTMGLVGIAKIARGPAYAIAAIVSFGGVLFAVPFAK